MDVDQAFGNVAIAVGLGLLVGLQRERANTPIAGARTFPLITVLGVLCAYLDQVVGGWLLPAGLIGLTAMTIAANFLDLRKDPPDPGLTTEVAMLLMYGLGAFLVLGDRALAVAVGGGTAVLLQLKAPIRRLSRQVGEENLHAITQFVLITLVVLPFLPNRSFGPYQVLNPREIWLMVVLILGIGLAGFLSYRLFGTRKGTLLSGILGGLISSTATTVASARESRRDPSSERLAVIVIMIASAVVFVRTLLEVAIVAPSAFVTVGPPLGVMVVTTGGLAAIAWARFGALGFFGERHTPDNPSNLRTALIFGAIYAVVRLAAAVAKERFGDVALYGVAALSGLTDMDAITLSTAHLMREARLDVDTGWRVIMVAALTNLLFKLVIMATLGSRALIGRVAVLFGAAILVGVLLIQLWPAAA